MSTKHNATNDIINDICSVIYLNMWRGEGEGEGEEEEVEMGKMKGNTNKVSRLAPSFSLLPQSHL